MHQRQLIGCLLIVALVSIQPAFAADPQQSYLEGTNHLYNLDFGPAEATFGSLTREYPDNPDYWNALASTYWLRILYNQQQLNFDSFAARDRFGTTESKDNVTEAEEKQLRDAAEKAIATADVILKKDSKSIRGLYAKGNAYATLASFEATIKRSWISAAKKAKAAREFHKDILEMDPNYNDARTAVGIYDYAVGSLSWGARFLVRMVGLGGGDKEGGIRDLETAAAKGARASTEAKMLLVVVYGREKEFDKANRVIDELQARYPRNFMLEMSKASLYGKANRWDLSAQTYRHIADKINGKKDGYERMRLERVLYELANSQFQAQKFEDADKTFAQVAAAEHSTPNEKANAHLWMGRMSDTRHDRKDALQHYNAILKLQADPSIKSDAQRGIKRPFGNP